MGAVLLTCPDVSTLVELHDDLLAPEAASGVSAHARKCPICTTFLREIARGRAYRDRQRVVETSTESNPEKAKQGADLDTPTWPGPTGASGRATAAGDAGGDPSAVDLAASGLVDTQPSAGGGARDLAPEALPVLERGSVIDNFLVVKTLGMGGMGVVYLARDTRLGRRVALKLIRPGRLAGSQEGERLLREARAIARVQSPYVVTIYSVGAWRGALYLALEYLKGETLAERLRSERSSPRAAMRLGLAVARGLADAHAEGVLHLDLKPSNIVLAEDGRPRVVDFGLAALDGGGPPAPTTAPAPATEPKADRSPEITGAVAVGRGRMAGGTPSHMAPEQWQGAPASPATDVWALGVTLYELLAGERPFQEETWAAQELRVSGPEAAPRLRPGPEVPERLCGLVAQALEKRPEARPSAREVAETLEELLGTQPARVSEQAPFMGLAAFTERDALVYFGRDAEVDAFVERLRGVPMLVVVGPSGAGKSSFVQAGVIPRLRDQGHWEVLKLRPGTRPFAALAARILAGETLSQPPGEISPAADLLDREARLALELESSPRLLHLQLRELALARGRRILLLVDQLEELYTLVEDPEQRRRFLTAVCAAAEEADEPVRVVATIRDDFLGRLAASAGLTEVPGRVTVLREPDAEMLAGIVQAPVARAGYRFEDPGLLEEMVSAVRGEGSALPVLQFACQLLWEARDREGRRLTRAAYERLGGVGGALAQHADAVLAGLAEGDLLVLKQLLLRLVTAEGTRRAVRPEALVLDLGPRAEALCERLTRARLLLVRKARAGAEGGQVELAHESLVHTWATLARWIEESREEVGWRERAAQASELWVTRGRRPQDLWQGDLLKECEQRLAFGVAPADPGVRAFLAASAAQAAQGERRRRARRAGVLLGLAAVALLSAAAAWAYADKAREAELERRQGEAQRLEAERQRALAEVGRAETELEGAVGALAAGDLLESRARLRAALERHDSVEARALWDRLGDRAEQWSTDRGRGAHAVAFSPDGRLVAAASPDWTVYLYEAETRALVRPLRGHQHQVTAVTFAGPGRLVSGAKDGQLGWWEVDRGRGRMINAHEGVVRAVAALPLAGRVASAGDERVRLWSTEGAPLGQVELFGEVASLTAGADDTFVAGTSEGRVALLGAAGLAVRRDFRLEGSVISAELHPSGRWLVAASRRGRLVVWTTDDGQAVRHFEGTGGGGAAFLAGSGALAWVDASGAFRLWQPADGKEGVVRVDPWPSSGVLLATSPSGDRVATSSRRSGLRVWRLLGAQREPRPVGGHLGQVLGVAISPDGTWAASGGARDERILLWDLTSGAVTRVLDTGVWGLRDVAVSPDGELVAGAGQDGELVLFERSSGERTVLSQSPGGIEEVHFSPDGDLLAAAGLGAATRVWDVARREPLCELVGHSQGVTALAFAPDGGWVATGSSDLTLRRWDPRTGAELGPPWEMELGFGLDVAPDGHWVAAASAGGRVWLYAVPDGARRLVRDFGERVIGVSFHPRGHELAATLAGGTVALVGLDGTLGRSLLGHREEANAVAYSRDGTLLVSVADDRTVRAWDARSGRPLWGADPTALAAKASAPEGVTAEVSLPTGVVQGRSDGTLSQGGHALLLEGAPSAAVTHLAAGPQGTLVAAFSNGHVGLWALASGRLLDRVTLHGTIVRLSREGPVLTLESELGGRYAWNLSRYAAPYCEILREVWREVPLVWEAGGAVSRAAPADHPCRTP